MVRFQPDTWRDALLRPLAMAAPDGNVYVEIMAPDFRFLFALVVLLLLAAMWTVAGARKRAQAGSSSRSGSARPLWVLLLAVVVAFVPWLAGTGNGRYFVPVLLIMGPVCIGLIAMLKVTRALRLTLAVGLLAWQAFAVQQSAPFQAWKLVAWKDAPYFKLDLPAHVREQPATYVTMSAISYSLLAPMFHPQSRWISLHNAPAPDSGALDAPRTEAFLAGAQAGRLMLLVPTLLGMQTAEHLPLPQVVDAFNQQLSAYRLRLVQQPDACRFLPSPSMAEIGLGEKTEVQLSQSGFWLCNLLRVEASAGTAAQRPRRHDDVFKLLESQCPRFFPAGGDGASVVLSNGEVRSYLQAEMKAYVYDSGEVYYKYYRALNPVLVGTAAELLAGKARLDCGKIRGRSGLPWEREI